MCKRYPTMIVLASLLLSSTAFAQMVPSSDPQQATPPGERTTAPLNQALMSDRDRLQSELNEMFRDLTRRLGEPLGPDVDRSLSDKIMVLQHLEIDMAQFVMRYATDPELRRLATRHVEGTAARLSAVRSWQVNRQILQQQTSPAAPK